MRARRIVLGVVVAWLLVAAVIFVCMEVATLTSEEAFALGRKLGVPLLAGVVAAMVAGPKLGAWAWRRWRGASGGATAGSADETPHRE